MKPFLQKLKLYFIYAALFSMFLNSLQLTFPIYMLQIYDRVLTSYSMHTLMVITIAAAIALVAQGFLDYLRTKLLSRLGIAVDQGLSKQVLSELMNIYSRPANNTAEANLSDVSVLRNFFSSPVLSALFDIPWTPIFLLVIYMIHPVLGVVATAGGAVVFCLGYLNEKLTRKSVTQSEMTSNFADRSCDAMLNNALMVKSMGMSKSMTATFGSLKGTSMAVAVGANNHSSLIRGITKSFRIGMQVVIYGVGAYLAIKGQCSAGAMIASSMIMGRALQPLEVGMASWKQFIDARNSYNKLDKLVTNIPQFQTMDLPDPQGALTAEQLTFVNQGRYILQGVSFGITPGEMMGIIGPSAAGKSTLCKFLVGIWQPSGGKVRLDGADMFQWDQEKLGKFIGYLPQSVSFFQGTIAENIARMGSVDPDQVVEAAKLANVHHMIIDMPDGYNTEIVEGGFGLSGGQQQRLALARAIYGNPKLLVLDEPYSNLDEEGEKALISALVNMKQRGTTIVVVSHKISILAPADKILVMQQGKSVLFGPKAEVFQKLSGQQQKAVPQAQRPPQAQNKVL